MARNREPPPPPQDRLDKVREAACRARDLQLRISSLEEELRRAKADAYQLEHEELPDLFAQAGMLAYALEAEGNMPAYAAKLSPYYKANIVADWEPSRRAAAFEWLAAVDPETGGVGPAGGASPDLIKTVITVTLGRGERKLAERVEAGLRKQKIPYEVDLGVPWNTLTAFVKELIEVKKIMPPLDILGATAGRIVTIKPVEKK